MIAILFIRIATMIDILTKMTMVNILTKMIYF